MSCSAYRTGAFLRLNRASSGASFAVRDEYRPAAVLRRCLLLPAAVSESPRARLRVMRPGNGQLACCGVMLRLVTEGGPATASYTLASRPRNFLAPSPGDAANSGNLGEDGALSSEIENFVSESICLAVLLRLRLRLRLRLLLLLFEVEDVLES